MATEIGATYCACCGRSLGTLWTMDTNGLLAVPVVSQCTSCLADEYQRGFRDGERAAELKQKEKSDAKPT
jgi:hypothetical protein